MSFRFVSVPIAEENVFLSANYQSGLCLSSSPSWHELSCFQSCKSELLFSHLDDPIFDSLSCTAHSTSAFQTHKIIGKGKQTFVVSFSTKVGPLVRLKHALMMDGIHTQQYRLAGFVENGMQSDILGACIIWNHDARHPIT